MNICSTTPFLHQMVRWCCSSRDPDDCSVHHHFMTQQMYLFGMTDREVTKVIVCTSKDFVAPITQQQQQLQDYSSCSYDSPFTQV